MSSLKLNSDGDLDIENNSFNLVVGEDEVAQKIKTVLRTIRGECFLNLSKGIPLITEVMGKNKNLNLIESLYKNEIIKIESVESLDSFVLEIQDDRSLNISANVNGNIEINEEVF